MPTKTEYEKWEVLMRVEKNKKKVFDILLNNIHEPERWSYNRPYARCGDLRSFYIGDVVLPITEDNPTEYLFSLYPEINELECFTDIKKIWFDYMDEYFKLLKRRCAERRILMNCERVTGTFMKLEKEYAEIHLSETNQKLKSLIEKMKELRYNDEIEYPIRFVSDVYKVFEQGKS